MIPTLDEVFSVIPWVFWLTSAILVALVIWAAARSRVMGSWTPVTLFFVFIVAHAITGTITAYFAVGGTSLTFSALGQYVEDASLAVSAGVASILIGYLLSSKKLGFRLWSRIANRVLRLRVPLIATRCGYMLTIGLLIVGAYLLTFGVPVFQENVGSARYLNYFSSSNTGWPFALNRGMELIQLSVSFLVVGILTRRMRPGYLFLIVPAFVAMLLTAHRTPIVMTFVLIGIALHAMGRTASLLFFGTFALALYLLSAAFFIVSSGQESDVSIEGILRSVGTGLPEVRDLAWVLSANPPHIYGLTYVVAFLPIPSWASDFTNTNRIRTVTLLAAGMDINSDAGGFRLTLGGENYLNFGFVGVILGGLLYGVGCRVFGNFFYWSGAYGVSRNPLLTSAIASFWLLYSFLFYLSGSGISGPIKSETVFVCVLLVAANRRGKRYQGMPVEAGREASLVE